MNLIVIVGLILPIGHVIADIQHYIPLQASARITDDDIVVLHDADNFVVETTTTAAPLPDTPVPNWSFVISDVVLINYATPEDRDIALQQITQVWQDALAPQVNDVQVVLVDDLQAPANLTHQYARSKTKSANLIIYVVLGNAEDPIDTNAAKLAFRDELTITKIPVTPVNLTVTDTENIAKKASNETFAILDSVWVKYDTPEERDELLRKVKTIWDALLAGMAFNVHLTLFADTPAASDALPHLITYIVTGRKLNDEQISDQDIGLKLQFRNLLRSSQYAGLWPVAFAIPNTQTTATTTTTTEKPSTVAAVKSPILSVKTPPQQHTTGAPFWITDYLILPYETVDQRSFFLQQVKTLWNKVLGSEATGLDIRFVDSVAADNDSSSPQRIPVYNVTYEISGYSVDPKILIHALERFHQAVAEAQGGGQKDITTKAPLQTALTTSTMQSQAVQSASEAPKDPPNNAPGFMWSLPEDTVQLTAAVDVVTQTVSTVPTSSPSPTAIESFAQPLSAKSNSDLLKIPSFMQALMDDNNEKANVQAVVKTIATTTFASVDAQLQDLIKKRFGGVTAAGMHATVFNDNIMFELNTNETSVGEIMEAVRRVWIDAVGLEAKADVFLSVVRNSSIQIGPVDSQNSIQNVDYIILVLSHSDNLDVESTRSRFRELLAGAGMTNLIPKTDVMNGLFDQTKIKNNIILGSLAVSFTEPELLKNVTEALQSIWTNVLGSEATEVQVSIYRDAPHAPTGPIAGNDLYHDLYYVVLVQTTKSDIDVDALRERVRELLPAIDIAGVTIIPPVKQESNDIPGGQNDQDSNNPLKTVTNELSEDPLLGLRLHHKILLNYSTEAQKIDQLGQIRQIWFNVFGPDANDIKLRLDNETTISTNTDGSSLNFIDYTVFVITKSTSYDQDAVLNKFRQSLKNSKLNFPILEVPDIMTATGRDDSEALVKLDHPKPVRSILVYDNVFMNYTTEKEKAQKLDLLKTSWKTFLGSGILSVYVRPTFDELDQNTKLHNVEYVLIILNNGTNLEAEEARIGFRKFIHIHNQTAFQIPQTSSVLHITPNTANFAVVPSGILIRYATEMELKNMLLVIQNLWQKVLGSNAPKVDIVIYEDTIRSDDQMAANDTQPVPVHYVSYVAVIQTGGKTMNIPTIIARFQELLSVGIDTNATKAFSKPSSAATPTTSRPVVTLTSLPTNRTTTFGNYSSKNITVISSEAIPHLAGNGSSLQDSIKVNNQQIAATVNATAQNKTAAHSNRDRDSGASSGHTINSHVNGSSQSGANVTNIPISSNSTNNKNNRTSGISFKMVIVPKGNVSSPTLTKKDSLTLMPTAHAGPAVAVAPLPKALVIDDHIWLVYKNTTERDNILQQIRDVWRKTLKDYGAINISLTFDFEAIDHSASTLPNSHKVFYKVIAAFHNDTGRNDVYKAKHKLRRILPTGKFMFGFDVEEVNEFNREATNGFEDIVAENLPKEEKAAKEEVQDYDELDDAPVTSKITSNDPKMEIVHSLILQYSDDEERDAEVEQLRLLWIKIIGRNVTVTRLSDKMLSTDDTFAPGSVHEFNYTVQLLTKITNTSAVLTKSFETALQRERFPFVLNASELVHPIIPEHRLTLTLGSIIKEFTNVTFNGVPIKNVNQPAIPEQIRQLLTNSSATISLNGSRTVANGNTTDPDKSPSGNKQQNNVVHGSFYIRYTNESEKSSALGNVRDIWKSLFGFDDKLVNLTLTPDSGQSNTSDTHLPQNVHTVNYTIWSPIDVDVSPPQQKFDSFIQTANAPFMFYPSREKQSNGTSALPVANAAVETFAVMRDKRVYSTVNGNFLIHHPGGFLSRAINAVSHRSQPLRAVSLIREEA